MLIVVLSTAVYIFGGSKSKHVKTILMAKARNLLTAEITGGWILISSTKAFCTGSRGWKSESGEIKRVQKKGAERLVRG